VGRLDKIINKHSATPTDNRDVEPYHRRELAKKAQEDQVEQVGPKPKEEDAIKYTEVDGVKVPF